MKIIKSSDSIDGLIRFFLYILIFWLPYSAAVVEVCVICSLVLWMIKRGILMKQRNDQSFFEKCKCFSPKKSPLNLPIFIFLTSCVFSVILSDYAHQSWHNFLTKTVEWFVIYFLVIEVFTQEKHFRVLWIVYIVTAAAVSLDAVMQYHLIHKDIFTGRNFIEGSRATASFKAPNGLGAYLSILIPFFLAYQSLKISRKGKFILVLCLIFFLWALILTFSKGAWISSLIGIFSLFIFFFLKYYSQRRQIAGKLILICVTTITLSVILVNARGGINSLAHNRAMFSWRIGIWEDTFEMIKDKPIFGHGINTYMHKFSQDYARRNPDQNPYAPTYAHNCYLQIFAETGIFGFLSFMWILIRLFKIFILRINNLFIRNEPRAVLSAGLCAGLLAFLIHCFVDTNLYSLKLSSYFWFMCGIFVAGILTAENESKAEELV